MRVPHVVQVRSNSAAMFAGLLSFDVFVELIYHTYINIQDKEDHFPNLPVFSPRVMPQLLTHW